MSLGICLGLCEDLVSFVCFKVLGFGAFISVNSAYCKDRCKTDPVGGVLVKPIGNSLNQQPAEPETP